MRRTVGSDMHPWYHGHNMAFETRMMNALCTHHQIEKGVKKELKSMYLGRFMFQFLWNPSLLAETSFLLFILPQKCSIKTNRQPTFPNFPSKNCRGADGNHILPALTLILRVEVVTLPGSCCKQIKISKAKNCLVTLQTFKLFHQNPSVNLLKSQGYRRSLSVVH